MKIPQTVKQINLKNVKEEVKRRLTERGFKIIPKTNKKFWAVKPMTKKEIKQIVKEITVLLEVVDMDGGIVRPVLSFSYALLNETKTGAAGISIEL